MRPAPAAAVRVCGGAGAALLRVALPRRAPGWRRAALDAAAAALRGRRGPHARAVHGRSIDYTKVQALPEWLGQCKLLEELCVPRLPPPCAFAAVPALRC